MSKPNAPSETLDPPKTIRGILRQLGPGLIIAGSIVGSGELIATTAVGAEAGFVLLWLIIIGCLIKVFVQIEFGRFTITSGRTTLDGLNEVPGPRKRVNWICWFWLIFIVVALIQLGGIIGGVGQALAIQQPITESGHMVNAQQDAKIQLQVTESIAKRFEGQEDMQPKLEELAKEKAAAEATLSQWEGKEEATSHDSMIWATAITLISIVLLVVGRYRLIQNVSTALVASFTLVTIVNLLYLQALPEWRVSWADLLSGMTFHVPEGKGLAVALAAFGIIGVGATELIQYPYWCLEKGYAKWTGPRDESPEWEARAKGWVRVLRWDAWCSMIVYTFATVAFYLLGSAILGRTGLDPGGDQMVRTLGQMYVPVFGTAAQAVFLFGAFAVLYSTFFVATASHARVCADALRVFGVAKNDEATFRRWVKIFCIVLPLLFLASFAFFKAPKELVLAGGFMGALMLPLLGVGALYFRYRRCDARLVPGRVWDIGLWISVVGLFIAGGYALYDKVVVKLIGG
ncbi:MAG: Nramp family divalent metal transporter [Akkermansiaceae bacterium]